MENISIVTLSACISIIGALWAINRDKTKDTKHDAENDATVKEEIKYIARGVEDIKYDTRMLTSAINGINERLTRVEESTKNAHVRIDSLKNGDGA